MVNVVSTEQLHNSMLRRTPKADTIDRGRGVGRRKGVPNQIPQNRAREVVRKRIISAATAEDTSKSDMLVVPVARRPGISHRLDAAHRDVRTRGFENGEKLFDALLGDGELNQPGSPLTHDKRKRLRMESPSDNSVHRCLEPTREGNRRGRAVEQVGESSGKGPVHTGSAGEPSGSISENQSEGDGVPHSRPPEAREGSAHGEVLQRLALQHAAEIGPVRDSDPGSTVSRNKRESGEAGKAATPSVAEMEDAVRAHGIEGDMKEAVQSLALEGRGSGRRRRQLRDVPEDRESAGRVPKLRDTGRGASSSDVLNSPRPLDEGATPLKEIRDRPKPEP